MAAFGWLLNRSLHITINVQILVREIVNFCRFSSRAPTYR